MQPTRLFRPWDFPGKSTGTGCHCLLQSYYIDTFYSWDCFPGISSRVWFGKNQIYISRYFKTKQHIPPLYKNAFFFFFFKECPLNQCGSCPLTQYWKGFPSLFNMNLNTLTGSQFLLNYISTESRNVEILISLTLNGNKILLKETQVIHRKVCSLKS